MRNKVIIEKVNKLGNFVPEYDKDAGLLSATDGNSKWDFGIDIDGNVIFDFDENLVLKNIDVLIPRKLWRENDFVFEKSSLKKGNIKITQKSLLHKSFNFPNLRAYNIKNKSLLLTFHELNQTGNWVQISEDCYAYVFNENELQGFYFENIR